jgi:hypothetical protein
MTDELQKKIDQLTEERDIAREKYEELDNKLDQLREKMKHEELKNIEKEIPFYVRKLERIRKYMDAFMVEHSRRGNVEYAFQKVDGYIDDFHNPTMDPLNWKLSEYDLLEMSQHLEIVFEYSNEAVRGFVDRWLKDNVFYANETSRESMFTLKLDRK